MSSTSPSPISPVAAVPPGLSNSTPSPSSSPPPPNSSSPTPWDPPSARPPQSNSSPPTVPPLPQSLPPTTETQNPRPSPTPPMDSPPPTSPPPPPTNGAPPSLNLPPASSPPPPILGNTTPPPVSPPAASPPPDPPASPPPPPPSSDPPSSSPPPPSNTPPPESPPPPNNTTPPVSPPPPNNTTPPVSPPPPESPPPPQPENPSPPPPQPPNSAPPPTPTPPTSPPPAVQPPSSSPPPPSEDPPANSPPPPSNRPPRGSPPPPPLSPPANSTSPPVPSRSPPASPPSSNSPPSGLMSPPPPSVLPPSLSPPAPLLVPPANNNTNSTNGNGAGGPQPNGSGGIGTGGTVAIVLVLGLLLLGIFGAAAFCVWKRKKRDPRQNYGHVMPTSVGSSTGSDSGLLKLQVLPRHKRSGSNGVVSSPREPGGMGNSRSWFTFDELVAATDEFSAQNLLGEGGFGSVYRGTLPDGRLVAVKQLKVGGGQGEREFRAEVEIISRIHHRHLVSLVGYCISDEKRLLVYEYVPNDTLHFHLHGEGRPVMDWAKRVKIAIGAARGIAYLHEDCHPRIIHRDIKSSNILLDNNFEARVADFGLAKLAMDTNTHITTRVMGTFGYMAPEYASSGKLTDKSDVYSFGVVLLELVTGRKPVDTAQPLGEESVVEWARPLLSHALETADFTELADPRLEGNYDDGEMFRMIEAAAACVRHSSAKRPKMVQVVRAFDGMVTSDLTNGMRVGESEIFNSAEQSAEIRLFRRMAFGSQNYSTDFFSQSSQSSDRNQGSNRRDLNTDFPKYSSS